MSDQTPVSEPTEDETPCRSALVPGVIVCHDLETGLPRPHGHTPPHTARSQNTGSKITWSIEEGTSNG